MCQKVECKSCGKATWKGCGQHIDAALTGVSEEARCPGWRTGICVGPPKGESGGVSTDKDSTGK